MQKKLIWFTILLKIQMKNTYFWIQLVMMIFFVYLIVTVTLPKSENTKILLCNEDGVFSEQIVNQLINSDSIFTFVEESNRNHVEEMIVTGKADCGFVIKKGFYQKLKSKQNDNIVEFIISNNMTKGAIARETFYATFFSIYSEILLEQSVDNIFLKPNEKLVKELISKNMEYLNGNEIFDVIFEKTDISIKNKNKIKEIQPIRGMVGIIIFLSMLMVRGEEFYRKGGNFVKYLPLNERRVFIFIKYMSVAIIQGFVGIFLFVYFRISKNIWLELLSMFCFLVVCAIWVTLFGKLLRRSVTYFSWVFTLLACNLIITPIFFNLEQYIPAIRVLSFLFPVGMYLNMIF